MRRPFFALLRKNVIDNENANSYPAAMPTNRPSCVVCDAFAPALYGGIKELPICYRCYHSGDLARWFVEHPDRDPDRLALPSSEPAKIVEGEFEIVGNEKDGPLEKCVPRYRRGETSQQASGPMLTRDILDGVLRNFAEGRRTW